MISCSYGLAEKRLVTLIYRRGLKREPFERGEIDRDIMLYNIYDNDIERDHWILNLIWAWSQKDQEDYMSYVQVMDVRDPYSPTPAVKSKKIVIFLASLMVTSTNDEKSVKVEEDRLHRYSEPDSAILLIF